MATVLPSVAPGQGGLLRTDSKVWASTPPHTNNRSKVNFKEHQDLLRRASFCSQDGQIKSGMYLKEEVPPMSAPGVRRSPAHHWNQVKELSKVTPAAVTMFHKGNTPPAGISYGIFDVPSPSRGALPSASGYDFSENIQAATPTKIQSSFPTQSPARSCRSVGWKIVQEKTKQSLFGNVRRFLEACKKSPSQRKLLKQKTQDSFTEIPLEETENPVVSHTERKISGTPIQRFRKIVKIVQLLQRAIRNDSPDQQMIESKLLSFTQMQEQIRAQVENSAGDNIGFDPNLYKAPKDHHLSQECKQIMKLETYEKTEEQTHLALIALKQAVEAFGEFPLNMQQSLVKRGWYENFESKRTIIRQGHVADNFYFIISGTAVVTVMDKNPKTGEPYGRTVAILGKGNSFGELALMHGAKRSATVTCKEDVELLAVGREDFVDIFMHVEKDKEPDHISFLRQIDLLQDWPLDKLPWSDPKICLFTYFRRGVVMCRDSNKCDWLYVIKSGSCRVLKRLDDVNTQPSTRNNTRKNRETRVDRSRSIAHDVHLESLQRKLDFLAVPSVVRLPALDARFHKRRANTCPSVRPCPQRRGLTDVLRKDRKEAFPSVSQHQRFIERRFNKKQVTFQVEQSSRASKQKKQENETQTVFVHVQKLGPKDVFGLVHVSFEELDRSTSVSLVSEGAEAVLINKRYFQQHLDDRMTKKLRKSVQPYPTDEALQRKLEDKINWDAYRSRTLNDYIVNRKHVIDTLNL